MSTYWKSFASWNSKKKLFKQISTGNSSVETDTNTKLQDIDESDNDYSYSHPIIKKSSTNNIIARLRSKTSTATGMQSTHSITESSFQNFRIHSLTIISMDSESAFGLHSPRDSHSHRISFGLDMLGIFEEKADFIKTPVTEADSGMIDMLMNDVQSLRITNRQQKEFVESVVSPMIQNSYQSRNMNEDIITQLISFGYDRFDIMRCMECVTDANNINEIRERLDKLKQNKKSANNVKRDSVKHRENRKIFIEKEIIETEQNYCNTLDTLLNEIIEPLFTNGYVKKELFYDQIRSTLPNILEFHKNFLQKLMECNDGTLANVFNNCIKNQKTEFIEMYTEFIKDYDTILDLFGKTFHGNNDIQTFLKNKRKERKPLSGLLISPVQRVPRYILLLTDLHRNTEKCSEKDISDAVEMIKDITQTINEKKRKIENLSQCLQIQEQLNGLEQSIVNDNRQFIEQFIFIKKENKHQRLFFMFNDILIIANEQWKVKHDLNVITLDIKVKCKENIKNKDLPEFELISGKGSDIYIGKDMETINKFQKLIGKYRIQVMSQDITLRCDTLGSLKDLFARESVLYE